MIVKRTCGYNSRSLLLAAVIFLQACVSVPFDYPKEASQAAPPPAETAMGASAMRWQAKHGDASGFVGLGSGTDGLGARLRMIELAESTIDAQYFLIKPDRAGELFAGGLLLAADRGVKVRLLLDDIFTTAPDGAMALLNTHPNIEVRLFNPMSRQSFKYWNYLTDFSRANRRMHNKSFTADSSYSIVGGRNIAEEYFELNETVQFDDYEVLVIGSVVEEINAGFDQFWNSDLSVPMEAFDIEVDDQDLARWRGEVQQLMDASKKGVYSKAVNSPLIQDLVAGKIEPVVAPAVLITDSPEKLQGAVGDRELATLAVEINNRFRAAETEIIIITPYFVPGEAGVKTISELIDKGTRVVVVTNSLASTNHVPVHSGYARYRKPLLEVGAEIFEIKADAVSVPEGSDVNPEILTLHSKATIIDRSTVFIGSLNFDPRSIAINTEMGLFIESEVAGEGLFQSVRDSLGEATYKVVLDDQGKLNWIHLAGTENEEILTKEPLTSFGRRFSAGFYGILPIESQL
jgi:putative cardiolipin synthase